MELISVIVPIYKVEQYLSRCIESLLEQSYNNIELILVDDGSPDRCGEICEEYAQKDNRIKIVHKKNGGLSDARNAGLKIASGNYVAFVDSDDWVSKDYLKSMLVALEKSKSDICECEVIRTSGVVKDSCMVRDGEIYIYQTEEALKLLIQDQIFHQYVWNKLYRRECLENIPFEVGKINEDEFWTYQVFGRAKKVVKIFNRLYFYLQRDSSIMGKEFSLKRLDALEAKALRQKYIDKYYPELSLIAKVNFMQSCVYSGQMSLLYLDNIERTKAMSTIKEYFNHICDKKCILNISSKQKIWYMLAVVNLTLVCKMRNFLRIGF